MPNYYDDGRSAKIVRSSAYFAERNRILGPGAIGYEEDTGKEKQGDGETRWNDLSYRVSVGGASFNPDGSIQDSVGISSTWTPPIGETTTPPFDSPGTVSPAYPNIFEYIDGWFVVHQSGFYLVEAQAGAATYSESVGPNPTLLGWKLNGFTDEPYYLSGAFPNEDFRTLHKVGMSSFAVILPLPVGAKVTAKVERRSATTELTISYVNLTITQVATL